MKAPWYSRAVQSHALAGGPPPLHGIAMLYFAVHESDPSGQDEQDHGAVAVIDRVPVPRIPGSWQSNGETFANALDIRTPRARRPDRETIARFWTLGTRMNGGQWIVGGKFDEPQPVVAGTVLHLPPGALTSEEA